MLGSIHQQQRVTDTKDKSKNEIYSAIIATMTPTPGVSIRIFFENYRTPDKHKAWKSRRRVLRAL